LIKIIVKKEKKNKTIEKRIEEQKKTKQMKKEERRKRMFGICYNYILILISSFFSLFKSYSYYISSF